MNGSASCTTSCWPSPPSTGSPPPATSSSSKATPTVAASAPPRPRLTTPPRSHHDAHVTGQVVPRSWRTAGPIPLAGDIKGCGYFHLALADWLRGVRSRPVRLSELGGNFLAPGEVLPYR